MIDISLQYAFVIKWTLFSHFRVVKAFLQYTSDNVIIHYDNNTIKLQHAMYDFPLAHNMLYVSCRKSIPPLEANSKTRAAVVSHFFKIEHRHSRAACEN